MSNLDTPILELSLANFYTSCNNPPPIHIIYGESEARRFLKFLFTSSFSELWQVLQVDCPPEWLLHQRDPRLYYRHWQESPLHLLCSCSSYRLFSISYPIFLGFLQLWARYLRKGKAAKHISRSKWVKEQFWRLGVVNWLGPRKVDPLHP